MSEHLQLDATECGIDKNLGQLLDQILKFSDAVKQPFDVVILLPNNQEVHGDFEANVSRGEVNRFLHTHTTNPIFLPEIEYVDEAVTDQQSEQDPATAKSSKKAAKSETKE
ncbi:MAG TPA: hypothetical protein V6C76_11680 [Drouetiella sp.]